MIVPNTELFMSTLVCLEKLYMWFYWEELNALLMHLSMLSPTPQVWGGWGFDLTSNQFPHGPGAEIGNQIRHLFPHAEVRKIDFVYCL